MNCVKITISGSLAAGYLSLTAMPPKAPFKPAAPVIDSRTVPQIVVDTALRYGVRPELALSIAWRESRYIPSAVNKVSGASGVMGLMPEAVQILGVADPLDPKESIDAGIRFLAGLISRYGEEGAVCRYSRNWSSCYE